MNQERVFQVLLGPHMSEKAAIAVENGNQYVFKVAIDATKTEIRLQWRNCSTSKLTMLGRSA